MSDSELTPAIQHLERKVNALTLALNVLRAEAGLPPYAPSPGGGGGETVATGSLDIKSDAFFGKRQHTAIREYLQMRYDHNMGPATPREIYDALLKGGFRYEAKEERTALVGLRSLLRRRTNVFMKVGDTGAYGLASWYPDAKRESANRAAESSEESSNEGSPEEEVENSGTRDGAEDTAAEDDHAASAA